MTELKLDTRVGRTCETARYNTF